MIKAASKAKKPRVAGPIDPDKLEGYVKRIEAVETEQAAYKDAKADIYTEVKASGMKPKLVRRIIKERKAKAADEAEEAELDLYRHALGMPGATYRSVAAQLGVPKSTLHRLVPKSRIGTEPPHDPETGEITSPVACGSTEGRAGRSAPLIENGDRSADRDAANRLRASEAAGTPETAAVGTAGVEPGPQDSSTEAKPDPGTEWPVMPERLRRPVPLRVTPQVQDGEGSRVPPAAS